MVSNDNTQELAGPPTFCSQAFDKQNTVQTLSCCASYLVSHYLFDVDFYFSIKTNYVQQTPVVILPFEQFLQQQGYIRV